MTATATKAPGSATTKVQNTVDTPINESITEKIARLEDEKDTAIRDEKYERAAELRDEIDLLKGNTNKVDDKPYNNLFDIYDAWKKENNGKTLKSPEMSFWKYMQANKLNEDKAYPFNSILAILPKLEDRNNLEDVKNEIQKEKKIQENKHTEIIKDEKDDEITRLTEALHTSEGKNQQFEQSKLERRKGFERLRQKAREAIEKVRNTEGMERLKIIEELKKIQEENRALQEENTKMKNTVFGDVKYEDNIPEEALKKIASKMYNRGTIDKDERGRKTLVAYQKIPLVMVRRRMAMKTIARALNEIKGEAIQGVDYIMAFKKARFGRYTRMEGSMARRSLLRKANIGRNLETFGNKFHEQKDKIMNVITGGAKIENLPEEERAVLKAIDQRMEYYGKKYIQDIYNGGNKKQ